MAVTSSAIAGAEAAPRTLGEQLGTYAVVLNLDVETEERLFALWAALDVHGVSSPARTYGAGYRPHLTLTIVDTTGTDGLVDALEDELADVSGVPVTLASLGLFLPPPCPAYLSVTPTRRLLELHDQVHGALDGKPCWDHYLPDLWVPHCTLAMGVEDTAGVARVISQTSLPIHATVAEANLVEIPRDGGVGYSIATFGGDAQGPIPTQARHRAGPRHRRVRRLATGLTTGLAMR